MEFSLSVLENEYDIIILTETRLNETIDIKELFDDRYTLFKKDRNLGKDMGGGVLIAITEMSERAEECRVADMSMIILG